MIVFFDFYFDFIKRIYVVSMIVFFVFYFENIKKNICCFHDCFFCILFENPIYFCEFYFCTLRIIH